MNPKPQLKSNGTEFYWESNEPVAWINKTGSHGYLEWDKDDEVDESIPLYTHPVKEQLTDEEIDKIENAIYCKTIQKGKTQNEYIKEFARAILRKAQEK